MEDDGVALQATNHPLYITDEMRAAGARAISDLIGSITAEPSGIMTGQMAEAAFTAMVYASPPEPEDLNEESLEHAVVEVTLHNDTIERFAIRCALGNNGGDWAKHYTPEQKEHWRQFVRELADDIMIGCSYC